jgi:RNA polymerase sigma factor, sigma-70 family
MTQSSLISIFAEQFIGKLFYYCLKKTGRKEEAEELTSDIAVCVISALRGGIEPIYFSAWIWRIAHNRWTAWVDRKRRYNESVSGADFDIQALKLTDETVPEDDFIQNEDLRLLRRELAFTEREYRELIVEYYISDRKLYDIASEMGIPEGTVKARLFRSRKILKEGMQMAREFGVRSYKPEDVHFVKNGNDGTDGSPWRQLESKLNKNILLEAYNNPSTLEQLSMELGVAMPYMEEAVDELTAVELLAKSGGKYETSFPILSREAQEKIYAYRAEAAEKVFGIVSDIIVFIGDDIADTGVLPYGGYQPFEQLKWFLALRIIDEADWNAFDRLYGEKKPDPERPRGGKWSLVGYEEFNNEINFVGLHGAGGGNNLNFCDYKIRYANLLDRCGYKFDGEQAQTLEKLLRNGQAECDVDILRKLCERGYLRLNGDNYQPTFAIFKNGLSSIEQSCSQDTWNNRILPLVEKLENKCVDLYKFTRECVVADVPAKLDYQGATSNTFALRGYMVKLGLERGLLVIPDDIIHTPIALACGI